uniref:Ig-like domain-containing protein n=1 Tax=Varanus komodoensis TaxID=61221 RepID=A0A8D2JKC8_VARKO
GPPTGPWGVGELVKAACGEAAAASHSLRYFHTALSEPVQGLPQFVQVGYVDDQPIDLNDSARQELPQVPRMELHADGPWPWDRRSRAPWSAEQVSLANLATLQKYYSQSGGLHTLQWMFGCELRSDGSKGGYMQFGYDGRDFLSLDKEHLRWTAADATAQLTKRKWEAEPAIAQGWKAYLEGECVEWLRRYLEYGKETLQRTEPPEVKVTHQKSSTENVETLVCQAHGFYPKEIEAAWTRDGENWEHGTFCNRVAPIPDGTYYISLYTDVEPEERGRYRCRVAHAGLSQPLALAWEGPAGERWLAGGRRGRSGAGSCVSPERDGRIQKEPHVWFGVQSKGLKLMGREGVILGRRVGRLVPGRRCSVSG